jgi:hypothetical protein
MKRERSGLKREDSSSTASFARLNRGAFSNENECEEGFELVSSGDRIYERSRM